MRIAAFSDWHGQDFPLPPVDLYVCTGDMLPNTRAWRWVDKAPEQRAQREWMLMSGRGEHWGKKLYPGAPLFAVRGNHDFDDLSILFRECPVREFMETPQIFEFGGLRFGGFRGVLRIDGEQSDEIGEREMEAKLEALGPVDVLVTHGPPEGILDNGFGSEALRAYVDKYRGKPLRAHLFGHIHEAAGKHVDDIGMIYCNAARGVKVIEV